MQINKIPCVLLILLLLHPSCTDSAKQVYKGVYESKDGQVISISEFDTKPLGVQHGEMLGYYNYQSNKLGLLTTSDSLIFIYGPSWMNTDSAAGIARFNEGRNKIQMNGEEYIWQDIFDTQILSFENDGLTFEGELVVPSKGQNVPLVILIQGSGNGGRNYLYYQSLAQYLAHHGIATFRYDKRGTGKTGGVHEGIPFEKLASDVNAAIKAVSEQSQHKFSQTGVWGLSQGGWIGPLAASMNSDIDFVVMVSAPTTTPGEQSLFSRANQLKSMGLPDSIVEEVKTFLSAYWQYLRTGKGYNELKRLVTASKNKPWFNPVKQQLPYPIDPVPSPEWVKQNQNEPVLYWVTKESVYDPLPVLKTLNIPILAIYGSKDKIVPVERSVEIINQAMAGKRQPDIEIFENGNHILMTAEEGGMQEFPKLQKLEDGYFEVIKNWIIDQHQ